MNDIANERRQPLPAPRIDGSDSARRPRGKTDAIADRPAMENSCVQRDRRGGVQYAMGEIVAARRPERSVYDTISNSDGGVAAYNGGLAWLSERFVTAIEGIESALRQIAAGSAAQPEPVSTVDRVLGTKETARLLGLDEQTVRKYCRQRVFGTQTTHRRWVIRQSEVDRYLEGRDRIHGKGKGAS